MTITINTPALLFPAISLIMLAYTNRFLALSSVVRHLHDKYKSNPQENKNLHAQLRNLRYRLKLIRQMQFLGVISFLLSLTSMYFISINNIQLAEFSFALSLIYFAISLVISLIEIQKSTKAIELELSDMEGFEQQNLLSRIKNYFNSIFLK